MANSQIECKIAIRDHKRRLVYHNKRTNKTLPIVLGKRGGLSVKSPKSKTRRYVKKSCRKNGTKSFWEAVKQMQKKM